MSLQYNEGCV